jgi:hypothetical protein
MVAAADDAARARGGETDAGLLEIAVAKGGGGEFGAGAAVGFGIIAAERRILRIGRARPSLR